MSKFHAAHYNAIAKDIRELFPIDTQDENARRSNMTVRATLANVALKFAKRFEADNELFKPLKFLDACSPDTDLYPLSELWEDYDG